MARVWGNGDNANAYKDAKVAFTKPKSSCAVEVTDTKNEKHDASAEASAPKARRNKEVQIDATTMVPSDLYWTMLRAGEKAKNGGQHRLKTSHRGVESHHLVRSS